MEHTKVDPVISFGGSGGSRSCSFAGLLGIACMNAHFFDCAYMRETNARRLHKGDACLVTGCRVNIELTPTW